CVQAAAEVEVHEAPLADDRLRAQPARDRGRALARAGAGHDLRAEDELGPGLFPPGGPIVAPRRLPGTRTGAGPGGVTRERGSAVGRDLLPALDRAPDQPRRDTPRM